MLKVCRPVTCELNAGLDRPGVYFLVICTIPVKVLVRNHALVSAVHQNRPGAKLSSNPTSLNMYYVPRFRLSLYRTISK